MYSARLCRFALRRTLGSSRLGERQSRNSLRRAAKPSDRKFSLRRAAEPSEKEPNVSHLKGYWLIITPHHNSPS